MPNCCQCRVPAVIAMLAAAIFVTPSVSAQHQTEKPGHVGNPATAGRGGTGLQGGGVMFRIDDRGHPQRRSRGRVGDRLRPQGLRGAVDLGFHVGVPSSLYGPYGAYVSLGFGPYYHARGDYPNPGRLDGYLWHSPRYALSYPSPSVYDGGTYRAVYDEFWPANDALAGVSLERLDDAGSGGYTDPWSERRSASLVVDALERFRRARDAEARDETESPVKKPDEIETRPGKTSVRDAAAEAERNGLIVSALRRGDRAFEIGEYDQAREEYVRALVLAGDDASVRIALGLAEYALGAYADASQAVRRGVANAPGLAQSAFDLAQVYGRANELAAHRRALVDFQRENPEDVHSLFLLGFVQFFSGQKDEGRATLDAYLSKPSHDPTVTRFIELTAPAGQSQ